MEIEPSCILVTSEGKAENIELEPETISRPTSTEKSQLLNENEGNEAAFLSIKVEGRPNISAKDESSDVSSRSSSPIWESGHLMPEADEIALYSSDIVNECESETLLHKSDLEFNTSYFSESNSTYTDEPFHTLDFVNVPTREEVKKNINNKIVEKTIECPVCHKFFTFIRNLYTHMTVHSGENLYKCPVCDKCFTKKVHYEEHCTVHSNSRPYECKICNKSFKCKSTLNRHSRLHSKDHPHHCPVCNKIFTTRQHLQRHIQTHTGEKPFKCRICPSSFSQSSSLSRHLLIHSGEKPHVCPVCKKAFSFKNDLKIHGRVHTGEKPYICPVCKKGFTQKGNLVHHMRVHVAK